VDDIACLSSLQKHHAYGVDDGRPHLVSDPSTVLGVGHFSRAPLDHSCSAPKVVEAKRLFIELFAKKTEFSNRIAPRTGADLVAVMQECPYKED
jgi:hypothetical protein